MESGERGLQLFAVLCIAPSDTGANSFKTGHSIRMRFSLLVAGLLLASATPAAADDDAFGVWLNPSAAIELDDDTGLEIETAQRFRDSDDGPDTYYGRFWVIQDLSDVVSVSGGIERRINDGDADETRFLQQVSLRHGIVRGRVRFEQRLVDGADRLGLRVRARAGVVVPLDQDGRWALDTYAEGFWTVRSTSLGGQDGLTGLRTQLGVAYDISDRLTVGLAYLRQQDIRRSAEDRVSHAPLISVDLSF